MRGMGSSHTPLIFNLNIKSGIGPLCIIQFI
nr:MAG TPA: hypothetical protein [Caudoviricetes sp.]